MPAAARGASHAAVNWLAVATAIYAFVAGLLLLRLAVGIYLTWRLVRAAKPMSEPWTADWSVRVSNVIARPRHVRIDHPASSAMHRLGSGEAPGRAGP